MGPSKNAAKSSESNRSSDRVSGDQVTPSSSTAPTKRRSFTIDQKLEAVKYAKSTSRRAAAKMLNIDRRSISVWVKNEEQLISLQANMAKTPNKRRLPGAGRMVQNKTFDCELAEWVREKLVTNQPVSRRIIQAKAREILQKLGSNNEEFKASNGWLERFLSRHSLRSKRYTNSDRDAAITSAASNFQQKSIIFEDRPTNFLMSLQLLRRMNHYEHVYLAHKTLVIIDGLGQICVDVAENTLNIGSDQLRIIVILTARADGQKSQPFVVLPQESPSALATFRNQLELRWSDTLSLDENLVGDYLESAFGDGPPCKRLLIWDGLGCTLGARSSTFLQANQIAGVVFPAEIARTLDSRWIDQFKTNLLLQQRNWSLHGESATDDNGLLGPLSQNLFLNWLLRAWQSLDEESIRQPFKICGFGGEDDQAIDDEDGSPNYVGEGPPPLEDSAQYVDSKFLDSILEELKQELASEEQPNALGSSVNLFQ